MEEDTLDIIPTTRRARKQLIQEVQRIFYDMALAEPTGKLAVRTELLSKCGDFLNYLRQLLLPAKGAAQ
jgi:hypothetical protein